jgi:hypothetical protein
MRNFVILTLIISSAFYVVNAQEAGRIITLPSGVSVNTAGDSWLLVSDSSNNKGLLSPSGKWLQKPIFETVIGPIGGTFFAFKRQFQMYDDRSEKSFFSNALYRIDTLGNIIDSLLARSSYPTDIFPSGIIVSIGFPDEKPYFIAATGKPIEWVGKEGISRNNEEFTGIKDEITVLISQKKPTFFQNQKSPTSKSSEDYLTINLEKKGVQVYGSSEYRIKRGPYAIGYNNLPKELIIYNNKTQKLDTILEDKKYKDWYFIPEYLTGIIGGGYGLFKKPGINNNQVIDIFENKLKQNTSTQSFIQISRESLEALYKKDVSNAALSMLLSDCYTIESDFKVNKYGDFPIVFIGEHHALFRTNEKKYGIVYFKNMDWRNGNCIAYTDSLKNVSFLGEEFLVVQEKKNFKLYFKDKYIDSLQSIKIPYFSHNHSYLGRVIIGKDLKEQIRVFHGFYSSLVYEEDMPSLLIAKEFDKFPEFVPGFLKFILGCMPQLESLETYSDSNAALIGLIRFNYDCKSIDNLDSNLTLYNTNSLIFNPSGLLKDQVVKRLKEHEESLVTNLNLIAISKDGVYINQDIELPENYYYTKNKMSGTNLPGVLKLSNNKYDFFIPCDSGIGTNRYKEVLFLYSVNQKKIFKFKHTGILVHLLQSPTFLTKSEFPENFNDKFYYTFKDKNPVLLNDRYGDGLRIKKIGNEFLMEIASWSGFIDKNGYKKFALSCEGGSCSSKLVQFKSGFAAIKTYNNQKETFHFIDTTGKESFVIRFKCVNDFNNGWTVGRLWPDKTSKDPYESDSFNFQQVIFNNRGNVIIKLSDHFGYDNLCPSFDKNMFFVNNKQNGSKNPKIIILDSLGNKSKQIDNYEFDTKAVDEFGIKNMSVNASEGLFRIKGPKSYKVGFADYSGNIVVEPKYLYASAFNNGLAAVITENDSAYFINKRGKELFKEKKFKKVKVFSEHYAFVSDSFGWYIIDTLGNRNGSSKFEYVSDFSNGLAVARNANTYFGYLDVNGKWKIPPIYKEAQDFSEGLAFVSDTTGESYFIDTNGFRKMNFQKILSASKFSEGLCCVIQPPSKGLLNIESGEIKPYHEVLNDKTKSFKNEGFDVTFENDKYAVIRKTHPDSNRYITSIVLFDR